MAELYRIGNLIEICLYGGRIAIIDDVDLGKVEWYSWSVMEGHGICYAFDHTRKVRMHHLILPQKDGFETDHINRNGLDNRRENLRYATPSQNKANGTRYRGVGGKFKGVYSRPTMRGLVYQAKIRVDGELLHLGTHVSEVLAAKAYNEAALESFGAFAVLNVFD